MTEYNQQITCTATEYRIIDTLNKQGFENKESIKQILNSLLMKLDLNCDYFQIKKENIDLKDKLHRRNKTTDNLRLQIEGLKKEKQILGYALNEIKDHFFNTSISKEEFIGRVELVLNQTKDKITNR